MYDLIKQIRSASEARLYYVALFSALTLPDICGALESNDGQASKRKFIDWFDAHITPRYNSFIDGETCYYYRCSMLHQGSAQLSRGRYSRIIFVEPRQPGIVLHNNVINDALNIDVHIFCMDICEAAERWWQSAAEQANVAANLSRFIKRHPNGLPPYIVGLPVIT